MLTLASPHPLHLKFGTSACVQALLSHSLCSKISQEQLVQFALLNFTWLPIIYLYLYMLSLPVQLSTVCLGMIRSTLKKIIMFCNGYP